MFVNHDFVAKIIDRKHDRLRHFQQTVAEQSCHYISTWVEIRSVISSNTLLVAVKSLSSKWLLRFHNFRTQQNSTVIFNNKNVKHELSYLNILLQDHSLSTHSEFVLEQTNRISCTWRSQYYTGIKNCSSIVIFFSICFTILVYQ